MNLKKLLILPVGFILTHVLYIGCCKCIEGIFHREISSVRASHYSPLPGTSLDTVYTNDSLTTIIQLNFDYISRAKPNPFAALVNASYATSCSCNNFTDLGYKFPIDSLVITSNNNFNGIPAGGNLVGFFKGLNQCNNGTATSLNYLPIQQMLDSIFKCGTYDALYLNTATLPGVNKIHTLQYSLFSNGKKFDATARKVVKWQ